MKEGVNHNATRAEGYDALTTIRQRSIITFAISSMIVCKDKLITSFQRLKLTLEGCHPLRQTSKNILAIFPLIFFCACSKPVYKIQTQEVFIPVKCDLEMPLKPQENGSFESHKALTKYYLEVEQIAKDCTNVTSK